MTHKHVYDTDGKQLCCSQEEKINHLADKSLKQKQKKDSCCETDENTAENPEEDEHEHTDHSDSERATRRQPDPA